MTQAWLTHRPNALRGRLLSSSCVAAAAAGAFPAIANAAEGDKWHGHVETVLRPGTYETRGSLELFLPLGQDDDSLFFLDMRMNPTNIADFYGNWGIGFRQLISPDLAMGVYGAIDAKQKAGNGFFAATVGVEAIAANWDAHLNLHAPLSSAQNQSGATNTTTLSIITNRLVEQTFNNVITDFPMWGVEGEVGVRIPVSLTEGDDLRLYGGGYHYWADNAKSVAGGRGTLEYRLSDVFGIDGSSLSIGATVSYDNVDHTEAAGEIRLRLPLQVFGGEGGSNGRRLSAVEERMTERVRRDLDVRTSEKMTGAGNSSRFAVNPNTNMAYGNIFYADGNNTPGTGQPDDPTTLQDAVASAGTGGIVVLDGTNGTISSAGVVVLANQTLIGAAQSIPVLLESGMTTTFGFGGTDGTVMAASMAVPALTLGNGVTLRDFTVTGGSVGILGNGITDVTLMDVTVSGSAGDGIQLANVTGTATITGAMISGVGGAGVSASNVAGLSITGSTISAAGPAVDVESAGGASSLALDGNTLSSTGANIVDIDGTAGTMTITSLNGNTLLGGNGETGGLIVETAIFGTGTDIAGGNTTVGTAAARINGTGVRFNNVDGGIAFGDLNIANMGAASDYGLFIDDNVSFNFGATGGSIDSVGGTAVKIDPVTANVTLNSITSTNATGPEAVLLDRVSGAFTVIGQTTITGAANRGISIIDSDGTITFGDFTIDAPGTEGIYLARNAGAVTFGDGTISNPGNSAIDFEGTSTGQVTFGNVDVTMLGAGAKGVDLTDNGAVTDVGATFATFDITGTGAAGSVGFDLEGSTNSRNVIVSESSTMTGLDVGANLTNGNITGVFRYGDGSNTDPDGAASTIAANTPIVVTGLNSMNGTYDFEDVNLVGSTVALQTSQTVYFVDASTNGSGTINDPGTIAGAEASGADVIILLDTQAGGAADIIDIASLGQNPGLTNDNSLDLDPGQQLLGFAAGDTISLAGGAPVNVQLFNINQGVVVNPNPGSGAPILTTTGGVLSNTVNLSPGAVISGVTIENGSLGGSAISGSGVNTVTISNTTIQNTTTGISLNNTTGQITVSDTTTITGATGQGVQISGTVGMIDFGGTLTNNNALAVNMTGRTGGTVTFTGGITGQGGISLDSNSGGSTVFSGAVQISNTSGAGVSATNNAGHTLSFTDQLTINASGSGNGLVVNGGTLGVSGPSTVSVEDGTAVALDNVAIGAGGATFTSITQTGTTAGPVVRLNSVSGGFFSGGNVTVAGTSGGSGNGIEIIGGTSSMVSFGTVQLNNISNDGIDIADTAGDISFGTTTIAGIGGIGIDVGGTNTGSINFGETTLSGLGANTKGLDLTGGAQTADLIFSLLNIDGGGSAGTVGIDLSGSTNAGTVRTTDSGSITNIETGVDLTNGNITGTFQYGDGSNVDVDGAASSIDATTPIVITGLSGANGIYNFLDVALTGDTSGLMSTKTVYYVDAATNGAGTRNDPGTIEGAEASGADVIILLDTQAGAGAADIIDVNSLAQQPGGLLDGAFDLSSNQWLMSFAAGDTLNIGGGPAANLQLFNIASGIVTNPNAGSGAPTLTTSALGGANTLNLSNNNLLSGLVIEHGGTGAAVNGTAIGSLNVTDTAIRNSTGDGVLLAPGTGTAVFSSTTAISGIDGLSFGVTGGSGNITYDGTFAGAGTQAVSVTGRTGGAIEFTSAITGSAGISLQGNSGGSTTFSGMVTLNTGTGDAVVFGTSTGHTLNFTGGLDLTTTSGTGLSATGGGTLNIAMTAGLERIVTSAGGALTLTDIVTSTGIHFDSVSASNGANRGISVDRVSGAGAVNIDDATINSIGIEGIFLDRITTTGAFTIGSITGDLGSSTSNAGVTSVGGHTTTINLGTGAGGITLDGGGTGLFFSGSAQTVNVGTGAAGLQLGTTTALNGPGISLNSTTGTFNFGNGAVTSQIATGRSTAFGIGVRVVNSDAAVTVANLAINQTGSDASAHGISIQDNNTAGTFTLAGTNTIDNTGGDGVSITGGNVSLSNLTIGGTTGTGSVGIDVSDGGVDSRISLSNITVTQSNTAGIRMNGTGGGSVVVDTFNDITVTNVTGDAISLNSVIFDEDGGADADFLGDSVIGGMLSIGQGGTILAKGLVMNNVSGDLSFASVDVNSAGTGLDIQGSGSFNGAAGTGFRLTTASGTINSTSADGVIFDPFTADVILTSITAGAGRALVLDQIDGSVTVTGDVSSTSSSFQGVQITNSSADVTIQGTTTVTTPSQQGILLNNATGTISFGDVVINGPTTNGIEFTGTNSGGTFGDVSVTSLASNDTGLDLGGSTLTGALQFNSLSVSGIGAAGSVGIDLRGLLGNQNVSIGSQATPGSGPSSSITNVQTGVHIDTSSAVQFTFGDGESGLDTGSTIDVISGGATVSAPAGTLAASLFNFNDVTFGAGDLADFPSSASFAFISTDGADTSGGSAANGSLENPFTVEEANAITAAATDFVFLDGSYDFGSGTTAITGGTFTLTAGQTVQGLANGNTVTYGTQKPTNILGVFPAGGGTVTGTGATLTSQAGGTMFDLLGSNTLGNFSVLADAPGGVDPSAIFASDSGAAGFDNTSGLFFNGISVQGGLAGNTTFNFVNMTGSVTIENGTYTTAGADLLTISGGNATYMVTAGTLPNSATPGQISISGTGRLADISGTTGGSLTLTDAQKVGGGSPAIVADDNDATLTFNGLMATGHSGTVISIDETTGGSTGAITFAGAGSNLSGSNTGTIFSIGAGPRDITATDFDLSLVGMLGEAVSITGQSAGTISFGNIFYDGTGASGQGAVAVSGMSGGSLAFNAVVIGASTAFNNSAATAVNIAGTGGSVSFGDLDITAADGDGLSVSGVALDINGTPTIATQSGQALSLSNVVLDAGSVLFSSVTSAGSTSGAAIDLDTVSGGDLLITSVTLDGASGAGLRVTSNTANVTVSGGTIGANATNSGGLSLQGGTGNITVGADITNGSNSGALIAGRTGGTISLTGSFTQTGTGAGLLVSNTSNMLLNVSGTMNLSGSGGGILMENNPTSLLANFSGAVSIDTTGGIGKGVSIVNNTSAGITFTGGLDILTASGIGFEATGGGSVRVSGTGGNERIRTSTGQILVMNGTNITSGMTFDLLQSSGTVAGDAISLVNVGGPGTNLMASTVSVNGTSGAGSSGIEISGGSTANFGFGTVTIDNTASHGIDLSGTTGSVGFSNLDIDGAGGAGISIAGNTNLITVTTGTIGATTTNVGGAVVIDGGTGDINFGATTRSSASTGINVTNRTGGTVLFSGAHTHLTSGTGISVTNNSATTVNFANNQTLSGTGAGIAITGNTNGAVNFSGAVDVNTSVGTGVSITGNTGGARSFTGGLDILASTTGQGLIATGGGTLEVTGSSNTIATTSGQAIRVSDGTTFAAGGLTFRSISSSGGSNAIYLKDTGSAGGFTITGLGSVAGSGGTLQNVTGADHGDEVPSADGAGTLVYLENVSDISLNHLTLTQSSNFGIRGYGIDGLTLNNIVTTGEHGDSAAADEGVVYINDLTGTVSITNNTFRNGRENSLHIENDGITGTLNATITGNTFLAGDNTAARGDDELFISADGGTVTVLIQNNVFEGARGDHIQLLAEGTANFTGTIDTNEFLEHANTASAGGGIVATSSSSGTAVFNITNNDLDSVGALGAAIRVGSINSATNFSGSLTSTISGNTIGTSGMIGSGALFDAIAILALGDGTSSYTISNNTINDHDQRAISVLSGEGSVTPGTQNVSLHILNNTINDNVSTNDFQGIFIDAGTQTGSSPTVCAEISGNTVAANANYTHSIRVRSRNSGTFNLVHPTLTGATADTTMEGHLSATNTFANTVDAVQGGVNSLNFVANCPN